MFIVQHMHPLAVAATGFLSVVAEKQAELVIKVLSDNGHMVKKIKAPLNSGKQMVELPVGDLKSGTYVLNAFNGDVFLKSIRFTKH